MTREEFLSELDTIMDLVDSMELSEDQLDEYIAELEEHDPELAYAVEDAFLALAKAADLAGQIKADEE